MPNSYAQVIKNAIVQDLITLQNTGVLGSYVLDDMSKVSPFDRTWGKFPAAVAIAPTVSSSEFYDVITNLREYTFWVAIVTKPDNMPKDDPTYLEGLMDAVMNVFDQDVTLSGSAIGGSGPAIIDPPGPVSAKSGTYVVFYVTIKAKQLVTAAVKQN